MIFHTLTAAENVAQLIKRSGEAGSDNQKSKGKVQFFITLWPSITWWVYRWETFNDQLTSREDIVIVYHDTFKGIGESEHIYIEINVVLDIRGWSKTISATLGMPKIQLLSCMSSFTIINNKVRATSYGIKYDSSDWKYQNFVLSQ